MNHRVRNPRRVALAFTFLFPFALAAALALTAPLASCGKDSSMTSPTEPSPATVVITINGLNGNMSFAPASATARVGQTVAWRNVDSVTHAIAQDGGAFSTGSIPPGATSSPVMVPSAGVLPYHCTIHPSMTGTLVGQ